jgi:ankyrin repeat protein
MAHHLFFFFFLENITVEFLFTVDRVQLGAKANESNQYKNTPLHAACLRANYATIKVLLDNGADPNMSDNYGRTALLLVQNASFDVVKLLLDRGADASATDSRGRDFMCFVAVLARIDVALALIEHGVGLNRCDREGRMSLHHTVDSSSPRAGEFVELLLCNGANANAMDKRCRTPLAAAAQSRNRLAVAALALHADVRRYYRANASLSRQADVLETLVGNQYRRRASLMLLCFDALRSDRELVPAVAKDYCQRQRRDMLHSIEIDDASLTLLAQKLEL